MNNYIKVLVEDIHSTVIATINDEGHPQTRVIDMMYYDEEGIYFLTAKGKLFYHQLLQQQYISLCATKDKIAISLHGKVKNVHKKHLDLIFDKNPYMKSIYPNDTREALEVFCIYEASGEYFDIQNPSKIIRESINIGDIESKESGYYISNTCNKCGKCLDVCPQQCIDLTNDQASIDQKHCLHCGRCLEICSNKSIIR